MNKSSIKTMPQYFDRYINLVEDLNINEALRKYGQPLMEQEKDKLLQLGDKVYAQDKWTVKDIIQHITDAERIFTYRALRIAREDKTPLPGFDENEYARHTTAATRTLDELLQEFYTVRQSTIMLLDSFSNNMLRNEGTSAGNPISVIAIGFTIAGHAIHHMNILKERYYPLPG